MAVLVVGAVVWTPAQSCIFGNVVELLPLLVVCCWVGVFHCGGYVSALHSVAVAVVVVEVVCGSVRCHLVCC